MKKIISFVHGYHDLAQSYDDKPRPCLKVIENQNILTFSYPFLRSPEDFFINKRLISGKLPNTNEPNFKKLPRFGFKGIGNNRGYIYCASHNAIYQIETKNFSLKKVITNQLMNNIHGICVTSKFIIHTLASKDTVVFTDFNGKIINHFSINMKLEVFKDKNLEKHDWRFISKQRRGPTGFFHFNYVSLQKKDYLYLTCRNINSLIVVNLKTMKAELKTMSMHTPALIHDGVRYKNKLYFTSIDGKIIIAEEPKKNVIQYDRERVPKQNIYNNNLITNLIRIDKKLIGKNPNWCRGIAIKNDIAYVLIDGRYDTKLQFSMIELSLKTKKIRNKIDFSRNVIEKNKNNHKKLRYCTGFDIILIK